MSQDTELFWCECRGVHLHAPCSDPICEKGKEKVEVDPYVPPPTPPMGDQLHDEH